MSIPVFRQKIDLFADVGGGDCLGGRYYYCAGEIWLLVRCSSIVFVLSGMLGFGGGGGGLQGFGQRDVFVRGTWWGIDEEVVDA